MDITVFPSRDFTSMEGFAPNADVLIQVRRSGVVSDAVGRTDAAGFIEVNHPGGVCWRNTTPDIVAGDTIRVTYRDTSNNRNLVPVPVQGSGAAINTQNVTATQASEPGDGTVVIRGTAALAGGGRIPLNRLEVRIVNPDSSIRRPVALASATSGPTVLADASMESMETRSPAQEEHLLTMAQPAIT